MVKRYLNWLNEDHETESVGGFAIDSFPSGANKKPLSVVYPESFVDELDLDIEEEIED